MQRVIPPTTATACTDEGTHLNTHHLERTVQFSIQRFPSVPALEEQGVCRQIRDRRRKSRLLQPISLQDEWILVQALQRFRLSRAKMLVWKPQRIADHGTCSDVTAVARCVGLNPVRAWSQGIASGQLRRGSATIRLGVNLRAPFRSVGTQGTYGSI